MLTVYRYKGTFESVPTDYVPSLVAWKQDPDVTEDFYFETLCEVEPADISAHRPSQYYSSITRLVAIKFWTTDGQQTGYVLADELMTAGL